MNILFISGLEVKEKGAQSIKMTIEGYAKAGHKVFFVTTKKANSKDYYYEKEYKPPYKNIKIIKIDLPFSELSAKIGKINRLRELYLFTPIAIIKSLFLVRKEKIDIVYGYDYRGVIPAYFVARLSKKVFISRFQGTILYQIIKNKKTNKKDWRRTWDHRFAIKLKSDLCIMTNDGTMGDKVLDYYGVPKEKVRFWMNGVNKEIYQPKYDNYLRNKYSLSSKAKILITTHRLTGWKKTERAINALDTVSKKYDDVYLVIVGEGERKLYLEKIVSDFGLSKKIFFAGGVPNNEIGKYLAGADIYLGTYDISNAGNPLFEAMLCNNAIIAMDNGTTRDFLGCGSAGVLIREEKDFARAIENLINNEEALSKYQKLAYTYALDNFWTWEERIDKEIKEVTNTT